MDKRILRHHTNRLVQELRFLHQNDKYLSTQTVPLKKIHILKEELNGAGVRRTFAVLGCEWLTAKFINNAIVEQQHLKQKHIVQTFSRTTYSLLFFTIIALNGLIVHNVYTQFPHIYYGKGLKKIRKDSILYDDATQFSRELLTHLKQKKYKESIIDSHLQLPPELYHKMIAFLENLRSADNIEVNSIFKDNTRNQVYHISYKFKWGNRKETLGNFLFSHVNNRFKLLMIE